MATPKWNDLPVKMKYDVIKTAKREPKLGVRKLAERFQCGKTQVSTILKNKEAVTHRRQNQWGRGSIYPHNCRHGGGIAPTTETIHESLLKINYPGCSLIVMLEDNCYQG